MKKIIFTLTQQQSNALTGKETAPLLGEIITLDGHAKLCCIGSGHGINGGDLIQFLFENSTAILTGVVATYLSDKLKKPETSTITIKIEQTTTHINVTDTGKIEQLLKQHLPQNQDNNNEQ
jgi:hypothetical protein